MPIIQSAAKRMRSDAKKLEHNQAVLSEIKTAKKSFRTQLTAEIKQAEQLARHLASLVDNAASRGVIPSRRADRLKARAFSALDKARARSSK